MTDNTRTANVPTKIDALVSLPLFPREPCYVLTENGWRGLHTGGKVTPEEIADQLRAGARVLFEGTDADDRASTTIAARETQMSDNTRMVQLPWVDDAETPEPPVKIIVPTGVGTIVSRYASPHEPWFVLTLYGWLELRTHLECDDSQIARELRYGARVLFEGASR